MSNIDKQALREVAEKATPGRWEYYPGNTSIEYNVDSMDEDQGSIVYVDSGDFTQKQTDLNGAFIAASNPTTVLALLDELEAKDNRINRLEAIVAVAEQRNAMMREWKRALKVPCDLVDNQVPVVIHGMVIRLERLKEAEAKLEAAEKRIAELEVLATTKRPYQIENGKWGCSVCHKRNHEHAIDAALCCAAAGKGE